MNSAVGALIITGFENKYYELVTQRGWWEKMDLKLVCVLNIIAVITLSICNILRNDGLLDTIIGAVVIIGEILTTIFILTGKIK